MFSRQVVSDSLQLHGLQQARLLCPSPSPGVCPSSCPIESAMPSNHLILCHLLLLPASIFPRIRVFSNESGLCIRWPKYWSFSFSPSSEDSVLVFFRIDWFYLLAVQGILKSLLQHHRLKVSNLWCLAFFMVQLTFVHDYWINHSFDSMSAKLCLCFLICCIDLS